MISNSLPSLALGDDKVRVYCLEKETKHSWSRVSRWEVKWKVNAKGREREVAWDVAA